MLIYSFFWFFLIVGISILHRILLYRNPFEIDIKLQIYVEGLLMLVK